MKNITLLNSLFKTIFVLLCSFASKAQISITSLPQTYTQDFNSLSNTNNAFANNSTLLGWYITSAALTVTNGSSNSNSCYNTGVLNDADRSIGALSTATTHIFGVRIKNNSTAPITSLAISYVGEQWRRNAANQTLVFDYQIAPTVTSLTAGVWTNVSALDFLSPNIGTASALDGNDLVNRTNKFSTIAVNIPINSEIMLRWVKTGTNSHMLSADDFLLTASTSISWDGTAWSNTTGPDATTQATIAGIYSTSTNGTFTAKNVVIQSGSLTINSGTNLTIQDGVENQLTETAFVIEDNANLIQTNILATNTGNATVKTSSAPMVRLDYTAWASPVIAQKLKAFSPQTLDARFYTYDPVTNAYAVVATPVTTNLETGVGYLIRASDVSSPTVASSYNAQFIGIPVNGTKTTPVSIGFNLLGNPYASKLDATTFLTNANTTALGITNLHFWTHTVAAVGGVYPSNNYATFNLLGGTAPSASGSAVPNGIISVGQGFFVNPTSAGNVTFNNTMRSTTVSTQFFKVASVVNAPSDKHRFWLNLTTPTTANNQILIGYVADASNDFDAKYDAALFGNTASVIYSKVADYKLAIQGRSSFATTDVLPLGLQATEAGQFTISLADFDGLFLNQDIFLKDNVLNTIQNLKLGSYTFNAAQGEFASRFEVVFESVALATNTNVFNEASVIVIKNNNGISIETGNNTIEKVAIYDIRGRLLLTKTNINASTVTLNNVATANQVLIVKITNTNNQTVTKKVVN
jgi:hypothetical protein